MATTLTRVRIGWGAVDYSHVEETTPQYAPTQYAYAGPSAAEADGGVGVRRATLIFDRSLATVPDDDYNCHFDFMNITGGEPDDTWTTADFTSLETRLGTWWTSQKTISPSYVRLYRIAWHRVGPGVVKPNPAVRILDMTPVPGTDATGTAVPQIASTITFRTGVRRSWGRTYLPIGGGQYGTGRLSVGNADFIVATAKTLRDGAAGDDFLMGVTSYALSSFLGIEALECDTTLDIVRRRRWKHTTYRKITPIT